MDQHDGQERKNACAIANPIGAFVVMVKRMQSVNSATLLSMRTLDIGMQ